MSRYGKVGVFRQIAHPRIRGGLDPSHDQKRQGRVLRLADYKTDEETYFVPSFSIRRHLHRSEELLWQENQKLVKRNLGRGFNVTPADNISIKVIEQQKLIRNMREAGIQPDPFEMRDIAYSVRDMFTNLLTNAPSPLSVPLGGLGRFGYGNNAVAYTIEGWRGDRADYGPNNHDGIMETHAVLLAERRLAVGALALAYGDEGLRTEDLAPSPHATIARSKAEIPDYRMREIRGEIGHLAIDVAHFGDPVIELRMFRHMPAEPIFIKHAWESLALSV